MNRISEADLPAILGAAGWDPRVVGPRTWRCTVQSSVGPIRLVTRFAGEWVYLTVLPFFDAETIRPWGQGKYPLGFLGRLLAVNRNLTLVKFALDDDGDVVLRTELPTESLQRREVETAALTMIRTTEQYREPVRSALIDAGKNATPR